MTALTFRSPVTRELRPYRGAKVPRPADAGDAFYVTSPFGPRGDGFHGGLDIGNGRIGYPVVAVAAGRVIAAGALGKPWSQPTTAYPSGNYGGLMVVIEHAPGVVSISAHMRRLLVSAGQSVTPGQAIGEIGDTGSAAGQAHVHFGVQAAAHLVPAGVSTHTTVYGIGLDVDPWPLITGQAALLDAEEDVMPTYSGSQLKPLDGAAQFRLEVDSHFRAGATRQSASQAVFPAGTIVYPSVSIDGELIGDNDQWAPCFMYVADKYRPGFFHTSVIVAPAPQVVEVVKEVPTGLSPREVYEAVDATARAARAVADTYKPS